MKKINVKNILIIMLIAIEVIATYFMYKSGTNKEVVLDNVELKELTDNNSFAIYLDGNEYNGSSTWPASAMFQKAECQNEKGDILNGILTFNEEENKAYVKNITQTTYCYLYFKSCNGPVGTVLADKAQVSKCEVGGMYRYQGTNDVNNWICFGTTNQSTCTSNADKYMYRIIGITPEGELKLIKDTALIAKTAPIANYANSSITNSINGNDFLTNSNYLSKVWQDLIVNHKWLYGQTGSISNDNLYNGNYMYEIESGQKEVTFYSSFVTTSPAHYVETTKKWDESVNSKIGLLYIYDYLFSYPGGNPGNVNNLKTIWLAPKIPEFIITSKNSAVPPGAPGHEFYLWNEYLTTGWANLDYLKYGKDIDFGLRPVFYLNKDVTFKTGTTGEKSNPYIIDGIKEETYTVDFHFGSSKNSTVTTRSVSWIATWTLPNATDVCFTTSSTSDDCSWTSLSNVVTSSYGGFMSFYAGTYTYYFYVRNAAGQIASDSDTLIVKEIAPTCSFNVTTSGVTLVPSNATSWYMSTSQTSSPSYGTETSTSDLGENTYYGYVQNAFETTGTCKLEMYKATQNACYQTGSSDGGYTNCTGTYMLGAYTPTEGTTTGECFLSHESSNIYNNCSAPCDVIRSGLGTIPSSVPTCPNGYYTLDSCTCSCQSVTTYTCSNGQTCGESGCCSSMFCGSDNCRSGYTAIEYDTYTRYCYK